MTAHRTQEIAVRMALGAGRREVRRLVLGNTIRLVALAAGIGIPVALALAPLLSGLLYQVELDPSDTATPVVFIRATSNRSRSPAIAPALVPLECHAVM